MCSWDVGYHYNFRLLGTTFKRSIFYLKGLGLCLSSIVTQSKKGVTRQS